MIIDEMLIKNLWIKTQSQEEKNQSILNDFEEYQNIVEKIDLLDKVLKEALNPDDYSLFKSYTDNVERLNQYNNYASFRAGCKAIENIINTIMDNPKSNMFLTELDDKPYIFTD